jgi:hypothetical protein
MSYGGPEWCTGDGGGCHRGRPLTVGVCDLDQFGKCPGTRARVDERNQVPTESAARRGVDQLHAVASQTGQHGRDVGNTKCDVVQTFTTLVEEPRDGTVGVQRRDQFDSGGAGTQHDGLDTLFGHHLTYLLREAEARHEERQGGIQVGNDVRNMMEVGRGDYESASGASESQTTGVSRGVGRSSRPTFAHGRPSTRTTSAVKSLAPRSKELPTP